MRSSASSPPPRARASLAALAALLVSAALAPANAGADGVTAEQARRLDHLLRHDCGSCHGMTMKGGLGPALLPATLRNRDEEGLVQMILYGNPAKAMPPWQQLLSEEEARWMVQRLKQGLDRKGPTP